MQTTVGSNGLSGARRNGRGHVLVTGGAGFVGTNLAARLLDEGRRVVVYDSLARPGVEQNLRWLQARHPDRLDAVIADVRDVDTLRETVAGAESIFHLAGQVAVTTSLERPLDDFAVNLQGTVALLEEVRRLRRPVPVLFTSTNKVYGTLDDVALRRRDERWEPVDEALRASGVPESRPLDFCTPYGCSKGGADQYVLDYAHTYGLPAVVFRMSCIYGPHQHGTEDQGWVAHFLLRARAGETITVYGDGAQVRDVLHASDLVEAMLAVEADAGRLAGSAFNVGGGPGSTLSLLELLQQIAELEGNEAPVEFDRERPGDQRWYVSDTSRLREATGWRPDVAAADGVEALHAWFGEPAVAPVASARAR